MGNDTRTVEEVVEALVIGADADIWYDVATFEDQGTDEGIAHAQLIHGTQSAMRRAAEILPRMLAVLEDVLHQLGTDSDLDEKVSRPDKYAALTAQVREVVTEVQS